uniref:Uncharacterized protein n=1 Tax=Sphaerodactylus townsendi TaxID=933632 RepID=A0ACB8FJM6_9SAUR
MPASSILCKDVVILSRTLMGPYGMDRTVQCVDFYDCANGLGECAVAEDAGREYGVYVKRILPGGIAYADGRLQPGDQILEVNGDSLIGVTSERAVDILRTASATSHMRLLIARDDDARHDGNNEVAFIPGRGRLHPGLLPHNSIQCSPTKALGNGLGSSRLKVHVRSPESRHDSPFPVPSASPDICPPELTISGPTSPSNQRTSLASKPKVVLDPHIRLKDGKLELMLQYLGLDVSEEKKRQLRQSVTTDSQGTVAYGDFLQALRDQLPEELEEAGLDSNSALFTQHEVATLLDTSAFHSATFDSISCNDSEELEQLQLEMMELRQEVRRLKTLLKEVEISKKSMEDELQSLNQKALSFLSDNRTLQNKLQVAEVSQRQAHSAEQDYEEVIHLLEAEIVELKTQLLGKKTRLASEVENDFLELKRRLSLVDRQLRRSEITRKRLEYCNGRLILFVQNVHKLLSSHCADEKSVHIPAGENKTEGTSEARVPSSDLWGLLIAEAKELLEPSVSSNSTKDYSSSDWDECPASDRAPECKDHPHQKTTWPSPPSRDDDNSQPQSTSREPSEKPA